MKDDQHNKSKKIKMKIFLAKKKDGNAVNNQNRLKTNSNNNYNNNVFNEYQANRNNDLER